MLAVTSEAFGNRLFLYVLSLQTFGQLHVIMPICLNISSSRHVMRFDPFAGVAKMVLCALHQFLDHGLKLRLSRA